MYVQLGGGGLLCFSAQTPACWPLAHISAGRLSVTMAIGAFQLPQCQIHSGEEKQSHYVITLMRSVGKGAVYLWGSSLPFSPVQCQHPFFLLFSQVLEVWSSVCPPVGWKHTWRCRHQVHVCRLEKAMQAQPQLSRAGVTAVGPVNDYLPHTSTRKRSFLSHAWLCP